MKIGMPALFGFSRLEDNFALAEALGFDFIELNFNFSYCRREIASGALEALSGKYGKGLTLHFFDEGDFGTYEEVAESYFSLLKRYLPPAAAGGVKTLVAHLQKGPVVTVGGVRNYVYEGEFDEYISRLRGMLSRAERFCRECGVTLALENSETVPYMERVYEALAEDGFSFVFDIGHDEMCRNLPRSIFERRNFSGVREFHIHDVRAQGGAKADHVSLGEGVVDVAYYKRIAERTGADCLLELKSAEDLRRSVAYFRAL